MLDRGEGCWIGGGVLDRGGEGCWIGGRGVG